VTVAAVDNEGSVAVDRARAVVVIEELVVQVGGEQVVTTTTTTAPTGPTATTRPPLVRTGGDVGGPARLAGLLVLAGFLFLIAGWQARGRTGLALSGGGTLAGHGIRPRPDDPNDDPPEPPAPGSPRPPGGPGGGGPTGSGPQGRGPVAPRPGPAPDRGPWQPGGALATGMGLAGGGPARGGGAGPAGSLVLGGLVGTGMVFGPR
jgi:hypothetical protein